MIHTTPKHISPLSLSGLRSRKSPTPKNRTIPKPPHEPSQTIFPTNVGPLIFQTIDLDNVNTTPLPYRARYNRSELKTAGVKRPQAINSKTTSSDFPTKGTRTASSSKSLVKQRKRTGTPNTLTDESFHHFPIMEYSLMVAPRKPSPEPGKTREFTEADRRREIRSFSPMKTTSVVSINHPNKVSYNTLKTKKEYKNNLFTVTASRAQINAKPRGESASRQRAPQILIKRIHSMKRDESSSGPLETSTNMYDSLRASFAVITQENQSSRLKDIEDLDELVDHLKVKQAEFGVIYGERIISNRRNSSGVVPNMLTVPESIPNLGSQVFKKNYSNLDKLLNTPDNRVDDPPPKNIVPQALKNVKPVDAKDGHKQNFMRTIYRGLRKSGKYHLDSNFMTSCEEKRVTFKKRVQSITLKNLNSFVKQYS